MKIIWSTLLIFLSVIIWYLVFQNAYISLAIGIGLYMAINIWANDVANNVWPSVWSGTLSLKNAIIIAAVWEFSWAIIAGWDVVKTIKKWIIDISWVTSSFPVQGWEIFVLIMVSALLAWAMWLTFATYLKAPVSTTHSIVWWVMGAWIAALWFSAVSWWTMWKIAASWVISPVLGWIIAALFLFWIKKCILYKKDKVVAAKKWVPFYVAIMSWAFTTYLIIKWVKHIVKIDFFMAALIALFIAVITYSIVKVSLKRKKSLTNTRESVAMLFTIPLIFAVALLSFAHWANDVANAIGPMAAIFDTANSWEISTKVNLPIWILMLGWFGIAYGLALFGPRIINTVGWEITKLDVIRAFSVALAASITVIIASQLGLPVSSTHIAIGWIMWVWFLREWLDRKTKKPEEKYVQRNLIKKIVAAWLITVPAAAILSASLFYVLKDIML